MTNSAPLRVLVDGQADASLSPLDRGLHFGDGIFETIRCIDGHPCWWADHAARLQRGAARLGLALPALELLQAEVTGLAQTAQRCLVKLIVTRGAATARGYAPSGREHARRIALCYDWPAAPPAIFRVQQAQMTLGENPALAGIKHLNRLEQVLAQRELGAMACEELLLSSASGAVVCGSMSNLFIVIEDVLVTPDLNCCGVEGVMRSQVARACSALQLPLRIATVTRAMLAAASCAFVTNVRLGLQPVHRLDGRPLCVDARITGLERWIHEQAR